MDKQEETLTETQRVTPGTSSKPHKKLLAIAGVVTLIALVGGSVYLWQQRQVQELDKQVQDLSKKIAELKQSESNTPAASTPTKSAEKKTTLVITDPTNNKTTVDASLILASGWMVMNGDSQLDKSISGTTYRIGYQITESDYLKGSYGGDATILKTVKLADGTTAYVIKTTDYVALSSCAPVNGKGCSFTVDGSTVLVLMHGYQKGDQYVRELNFNTAATNTAIAEFETMASTLSFK